MKTTAGGMQEMKELGSVFDVSPVVNERVFDQCRRAIYIGSDSNASFREPAMRLLEDCGRHNIRLRELAKLARQMVLGNFNAIERFRSEIAGIMVSEGPTIPPDALSHQSLSPKSSVPESADSSAIANEREMDLRLECVVDIFAGAAYIAGEDSVALARTIGDITQAVDALVIGVMRLAAFASRSLSPPNGEHLSATLLSQSSLIFARSGLDSTKSPPDSPSRFREDLTLLSKLWLDCNPVSRWIALSSEAKDNAAIGRLSFEVIWAGSDLRVEAAEGHSFGTRRRKGVFFLPGITPAKIVAWTAHAITVKVPEGAISGPVFFGRVLGKSDQRNLSTLGDVYFSRFRTGWSRSIFGREPVFAWVRAPAPSLAGRNQITIYHRARLVSFAAFDEQNSRVSDRHAISPGSRVTIFWNVFFDTPEPPIVELLAGKQVIANGLPTVGSKTEVLTQSTEITCRVRYPSNPIPEIPPPAQFVAPSATQSILFDIGPQSFSVEPKVVHLLPSLAGDLQSQDRQVSVRITLQYPAVHDLPVTLRSVTGKVSFAPWAGLIPAGSGWVEFVIQSGATSGEIGLPADTVEVDIPDFIYFPPATVEVWIAQPGGRWVEPVILPRGDEPFPSAQGRMDNGILGIIGIHAIVLRNGKVLYLSFKDDDDNNWADPDHGRMVIWDPSTRQGVLIEADRNPFCAGHCVLPDGRVLLVGGQPPQGAFEKRGEAVTLGVLAGLISGPGSTRDVHTVDPDNPWAWQRHHDTGAGRYYPTCVTLPDGNALMVAGISDFLGFLASQDSAGQNDQYEIFDGSRNTLSGQHQFMSLESYPIVKVLPRTNPTLLFVHYKHTSYFYDWTNGDFARGDDGQPLKFLTPEMIPAQVFDDGHGIILQQPLGRQTYPMQTGCVLLPIQPGQSIRLLCIGGSTVENVDSFYTGSDAEALRAACIFEFDPNASGSARWRITRSPPNFPRFMADAVLLPDLTVLVVNGAEFGTANNSSHAIFSPEIFNPSDESFTVMESNKLERRYHSTAVLLPDATVAVAGHTKWYNDDNNQVTDDDRTVEVFCPPYLFRGPRPLITSVPAIAHYAMRFRIVAPGAYGIERVVLLRPCAVTHSNDMEQRLVVLPIISRDDQTLTLQAPDDGTVAVPGYYMLFVIDYNGVPSAAKFIQLLPYDGPWARFEEDSAWSGWGEVAGGGFTNLPMGAADYQDELYLFAIGTGQDGAGRRPGIDQHVYMNVFDGQNWLGWVDAAGVGATNLPVAATAFRDRLYLFHVGADDRRIYANQYDGQNWSVQTEVGGLTNLPIAATVFEDRLYLFAIGYDTGSGLNDQKIYSNFFDGRQWSVWGEIGGAGRTDLPVTTIVARDYLHVFALGTDHSSYSNSTNDGLDWSGWGSVAGQAKTDLPLAAACAQEHIYLATALPFYDEVLRSFLPQPTPIGQFPYGNDRNYRMLVNTSTDGQEWAGSNEFWESGTTRLSMAGASFRGKPYFFAVGTDQKMYFNFASNP